MSLVPCLLSWFRRSTWRWLDAQGIPDGTPFLISPAGEYDMGLNGYGRSPALIGGPVNTQLAFARDMKGFLNFLWHHRPGVVEHTGSGLMSRPRSWKDATVGDRQVYEAWRNRDPAGPRVKGATWNREVATVDGFYKWAVRKGLVASSPIEQAGLNPVAELRPPRRTTAGPVRSSWPNAPADDQASKWRRVFGRDP
ncbi:hypothetical protein ACFZDK_55220 [Streptomyces sp. NPDC007901]|uniref:hypothetical protein n=1 Tax=Streptomyces sp. NPDC007901 TaxID=3364785 RepID=UPI0036EFD8F0